MNKILDLMTKTDLCVFSTATSDGQSHSAVVGFSANEKYEILIGTSSESRKFKAIKENPKVSLVIGWDENLTIQYEGVASQLQGELLIERQRLHFAKLPESEEFKDEPDEEYISVSPTWIRYSDCTVYPRIIEELKEF
ncbi:MAG TPA: pyridoxamine 5'-phosphate oxidase family protein [Candidatus Saccharimonadales bacterium]|nr:pyridoxamine 5'-phosphate oxidase family protein [Candidatus Saccharimonadales bacterium]